MQILSISTGDSYGENRNPVHRQLKPGGRIRYLKGGDLTAEMAERQKPYTLYNLNTFFTEDFFTTKKVVEVKNQIL